MGGLHIPKIGALLEDVAHSPGYLDCDIITDSTIRCKISGHTKPEMPHYYSKELQGHGFAYEIALCNMLSAWACTVLRLQGFPVDDLAALVFALVCSVQVRSEQRRGANTKCKPLMI